MATTSEHGSVGNPLTSSELTSSVAWRFYVLWTLAAATYGFGDMVTTFALIRRAGFYEANPLIRGVIAQFGPAGLAAVKFGVVALGVGLSVWAARDHVRLGLYGVPTVLVLIGVALTAHNLFVFLV